MEALKLSDTLRFITDGDGRQTAVVIPLDEWKELEVLLQRRSDFLEEVRASFAEIKADNDGEDTSRPIEELWDELPD